METSQAPEPPPKPGATRQQTAEEKRANDLQILNAVIATERAIKYTDMLVVDVTVLALILPWGIRTIRRFDHDEKMPRGYLLNGRGKKVWEMFHIRLWVKWHYPNRSDFEKRLQALEAQELAPEKPTEVVQA